MKMIFYVGMISLILGVFFLGIFAYFSSGSRNIALGMGTLTGAAVLFGIQLLFELQTTPEKALISTEYTIDAARPSVRQWVYPLSQSERYRIEKAVSDHLAHDDAAKLTNADGGDELSRQLVIYSLVSNIFWQHDWQTSQRVMKVATGNWISTQYLSDTNDCSRVTQSDIDKMLASSKNQFHQLQRGPFDYMCLPPHSSMAIAANQVIITSRFCSIEFTVGPLASISRFHPTRPDHGAPKLPNGQYRLTTIDRGIDVTIRYERLLSQHRDMQKYKNWAEGLVEGARYWFEARPNGTELSFDADKDDNGIKIHTNIEK